MRVTVGAGVFTRVSFMVRYPIEAKSRMTAIVNIIVITTVPYGIVRTRKSSMNPEIMAAVKALTPVTKLNNATTVPLWILGAESNSHAVLLTMNSPVRNPPAMLLGIRNQILPVIAAVE